MSCNSIIVSEISKIRFLIESNCLEGILSIPDNDIGGLVIFVHGSGSHGQSSRNEYLSRILNESRISTLLINLLSTKEREIDNNTKEYRFDIELLTKRLLTITDAMSQNETAKSFRFCYLGSSTGAAVAIEAAVRRPDKIISIVSRSGRVDLVNPNSLEKLRSPILLIVGSNDLAIIDISNKIMKNFNKSSMNKIILIPGATHLFPEPGKFEQVARIATGWFKDNLLN